jgi:hypothetical protein
MGSFTMVKISIEFLSEFKRLEPIFLDFYSRICVYKLLNDQIKPEFHVL